MDCLFYGICLTIGACVYYDMPCMADVDEAHHCIKPANAFMWLEKTRDEYLQYLIDDLTHKNLDNNARIFALTRRNVANNAQIAHLQVVQKQTNKKRE